MMNSTRKRKSFWRNNDENVYVDSGPPFQMQLPCSHIDIRNHSEQMSLKGKTGLPLTRGLKEEYFRNDIWLLFLPFPYDLLPSYLSIYYAFKQKVYIKTGVGNLGFV